MLSVRHNEQRGGGSGKLMFSRKKVELRSAGDENKIPIILAGPGARPGKASSMASAMERLTQSPTLKKDLSFSRIELTVPGDGSLVRRFFRDLWNSWRKIRSFPTGAVYHLISQYNIGIVREVALLQMAKFLGLPTAVNIRAGSFRSFYNEPPSGLPAYRSFARRLCFLADALLVQCPRDLEFIRKTFSRPDAELMPNTIAKTQFAQLRTASFGDLPGKALRLVYVGRLHPEKGIIETLEALRLLGLEGRELEYHIVGNEDFPGFLDRIERAHAAVDPCVGIRVHGFLPPNKIMDLLAGCHVFCLPSYYRGEGHSNALNEAMAVGLACIFSRYGHFEDIVPKEGSLWVEIKKPEEIAGAIRNYQDNPSLVSQAGRRNRKYVEDNYLDEKLHERLIQVYHTLYMKGRRGKVKGSDKRCVA